MHELSIALSLIDVASEQASHLLVGERVSRLHVRLGAWSGIAHASLRVAFDVAKDGTTLAGVDLAIETACSLTCRACGKRSTLMRPSCDVCGAWLAPPDDARDVELVALEVISHPSLRSAATS